MADDDAILRETKRSIDALFRSVSDSADRASTELNYISRVARVSGKQISYAGDSAEAFGEALNGLTKSLGGAAVEITKAGMTFSASAGAMVIAMGNIDKIVKDGKLTKPDSDGDDKDKDDDQGGIMSAIAGVFKSILAKVPFMAAGAGLGGAAGARFGSAGAMVGSVVGGAGGAALGIAEEVYGGYLDGLNEITTAGIPFGRSLETYAKAITTTTLTQTEFNALMKRNSETLSMFGGTAQLGAERLVTLGGVLSDVGRRHTTSGMSFRRTIELMGMDVEDALELSATMLNNASLADSTRSLSAQEQADMTGDYIYQLSQLEVLTGKSKDRLAKEQQKLASDAQFQAAIMNMGPEQQAAMTDGLKKAMETGGPAAAEIFKARVAGVVPKGKEARMMMATPMGQMYNDLASDMLSAGDGAGEIFNASLGKLEDAIEKTRDTFAPLAAAGQPIGLALFEAAQATTTKFNAIQDAYAKHAGIVDTESVNFSTAFEHFYDQAMGIDAEIVDGKLVGTIGDAATQLTTDIRVLKDEIAVGARELFLDTIFNADDGLINWVQGQLKTYKEKTGFDEELSAEIIKLQDEGLVSYRTIPRMAGTLGDKITGFMKTSIDLIQEQYDTMHEMFGGTGDRVDIRKDVLGGTSEAKPTAVVKPNTPPPGTPVAKPKVATSSADARHAGLSTKISALAEAGIAQTGESATGATEASKSLSDTANENLQEVKKQTQQLDKLVDLTEKQLQAQKNNQVNVNIDNGNKNARSPHGLANEAGQDGTTYG